jgi:hypothetical protein
MNETELQALPWDASYREGEDVILIDEGDNCVYLTHNDLLEMLEVLRDN